MATHDLPLDLFTATTYPYEDQMPFNDSDLFAHAGTLSEYQIHWNGSQLAKSAGEGLQLNEFAYHYPGVHLGGDREKSCRQDLPPDNTIPNTSLASLLATQRALYVTPSPILHPVYYAPHTPSVNSPSGDTHSSIVSTADYDVGPQTPPSKKRKQLGTFSEPDVPKRGRCAGPEQPDLPSGPSQSENQEMLALTPLEMPDGSTRLTSNWLPVDPEGGFTIGTELDPMVGVGREFVSVGG
ncbi:hypothetical protein BDV28DRAFT_145003 [Aspergillus coremiiformis]|uniref:Uncharacterized protein n=1 Tax=Aspergillus coremiiformis TaxID=138285 RepID=A0A5N6ZH44_9EURO|nr:hypothetical protein BDV28DRAFT_145003 [Aspergillus coremiiformis]